MKYRIFTGLVPLSMLFVSISFAQDGSVLNGGKLHQKQCTGCHQNSVYQRANRKVNSLSRLKGQVSMCTQNLNLDLFPEDEADIVVYLNHQFYHFER